MNSFLNKIVNPCCFGCESYFSDDSGFCKSCFINLIEPYCVKHESNQNQLYLLDWIPEESDAISRLSGILKSKLNKTLWQHWSCVFLEKNKNQMKHFLEVNEPEKCVLIPIPSRKKRRHSHYFSDALGRELQIDCQKDLLVFADENNKSGLEKDHVMQKLKSRKERAMIRFRTAEEITELSNNKTTYIFVDDVVTTGSSFKAAISAVTDLGHENLNFHLWTLFNRRMLIEPEMSI